MLRTRLTLLSLLVVLGALAISAVGATAASAATGCAQVAVAGAGQFESNFCQGAAGTKEYIEFEKPEKEIKPGEWCAKVKVGTGEFENNTCAGAAGAKEFIKVKVPEFGVCNKVVAGTGKYKENKCETLGAPEEFEWSPIKANVAFEAKNLPGFVSHLEGVIAGTAISIICEEVKSFGVNNLKVAGASETEIEFTKCKVELIASHKREAVPNCRVEPVKLKETLDQAIYNVATGGIEDTFSPKAGGVVFTEIELVGAACVLPKKDKVEVQGAAGSIGQICPLITPTASWGNQTNEHEMICTGQGSRLTFAGSKARFTADIIIKLVSGAKWYVE